MVVDKKQLYLVCWYHEKVQFDADPGSGEIRLRLSFVPSSTWLYTPLEAFETLSIMPVC